MTEPENPTPQEEEIAEAVVEEAVVEEAVVEEAVVEEAAVEEAAVEASTEAAPASPEPKAAAPASPVVSRRPSDYEGRDDDDDDYDDDDDDDDDDDTRYVDGPTEYTQRERRGRGRRIGNDVRVDDINYKNTVMLTRFLDQRGRILSRRKTKVSAKVQRRVVRAIKRARHLALLPYTADQTRIVRKRR